MTANEFYNEFNLVYNNLASNQAPGLDKYEISVYLTKAQNTLVDALYREYEKSEEARRKLVTLVVTKKLTSVNDSSYQSLYPEYTKVFEGLDDVRYIVEEQVKMSKKADRCIRDSYLRIRPILHDELDVIVNNPYKFNIRRALRLDSSKDDVAYIEILSKDKDNIEYYQIRYIKNPKPILLDVFDELIDGEQLTTTPSFDENICQLPEIVHRQIVEIAAKLAYQDYKS